MYLDTYIRALKEALRRVQDPSAQLPFTVEDAQNILWFLELLRRREGYNVERPSRRQQRERRYDEPRWYEEARESTSSAWDNMSAEAQRRAREEMFRTFYDQSQKMWEEAFKYGGSSKKTWSSFAWGEEPKSKSNPQTKSNRPWYEVLGLRPDATLAQRQKAYRSLAQQYHPDRPGGNAEKMSELNSIKKEAGL